MAPKQGDQWYCRGCGRMRAHEQFSGRGHARHRCQACAAAQRRGRRQGATAALADPAAPAAPGERTLTPEAQEGPALTEEAIYAWIVRGIDPYAPDVVPAPRTRFSPRVPQETLRFQFVWTTPDPAIRQTIWAGICNSCRRVSPRKVQAQAHTARARLPRARLQAFRRQLEGWQAAGYLRWSAEPAATTADS